MEHFDPLDESLRPTVIELPIPKVFVANSGQKGRTEMGHISTCSSRLAVKHTKRGAYINIRGRSNSVLCVKVYFRVGRSHRNETHVHVIVSMR